QWYPARVGDESRGFNDERGLITFTSMGNRSEIRTIGFDHQSIRRDRSCDLCEFAGTGEGHDTRKRNHEAQIKCRSSKARARGKAMENPSRNTCLSEYLLRIIVRL